MRGRELSARARAKDALIRALKRKPWSTAGEVAATCELPPDEALAFLEEMTRDGLLVAKGVRPSLPQEGVSKRAIEAMRARGWMRVRDIQEAGGFGSSGAVHGALLVLARRGLVERAVKSPKKMVWAMPPCGPPPVGYAVSPVELAAPRRSFAVKGLWKVPGSGMKRAPNSALSSAAMHALEAVRSDPWRTAGHYARTMNADKKSRNASYSVLEGLVKRGVLQVTSVNRIKHYGPADGVAPAGHMPLRAGAPSQLRTGGKERVVALLQEEPWQTVVTLAERLRLQAKTVDNLVRSLHTKRELARRSWKGPLGKSLAYALPASRSLTEEDVQRLYTEAKARLPERYWWQEDAVQEVLVKHPWSTAREVQQHVPKMTLEAMNSRLYLMHRAGRVQRVADGAFRYGPLGMAPPPVSGRHDKASVGTPLMFEVARLFREAGPRGLIQQEILAATNGKSKHGAGVWRALKRLEREGCVASARLDGRDRRAASHGRGTTKVYVFVKEPADGTPADVLMERMHRYAEALRFRGFTVTIDVKEPTKAGVEPAADGRPAPRSRRARRAGASRPEPRARIPRRRTSRGLVEGVLEESLGRAPWRRSRAPVAAEG